MQHIDTLCRVAQTRYNTLYGGGKANFISEWDVTLQGKKREKKQQQQQQPELKGAKV